MLHDVDQPRGAVVTNLQFTLQGRDRDGSGFGSKGHGFVIEIIGGRIEQVRLVFLGGWLVAF
ncbi:hypothetical protein ABIE61_000339 [Marinobacterium sp. MBR-111]